MTSAQPKITPQQMLAARKLLGLSRQRLATLTDTSEAFIFRYENFGRVTKMTSRDPSFDPAAAIRAALEAAGVEFVEENGGAAGVRMRKIKE